MIAGAPLAGWRAGDQRMIIGTAFTGLDVRNKYLASDQLWLFGIN